MNNKMAINDSRYKIRSMTDLDLPEVVQIEKDVHLLPWGETQFLDSLVHGYYCKVVEVRAKIVAYGIVSGFDAFEAEVLRIAVNKLWQRKGIGRNLMEYFINYLNCSGKKKIFLEVALSNRTARQLYSAMKFVEIGRRASYYQLSNSRKEDALVMQREL